MYLLRLDDASEYWDKEKWGRMAALLYRYDIKPIFAIIPHNEDDFLLQYAKDESFWNTVEEWIAKGWIPALHGYNHVMNSNSGGINPINSRSEFAGVEFEIQKNKIVKGLQILEGKNIKPNVFVAPGHTFDENTLSVLREHTDIRIVSDTIADDIYKKDGLWFIPQQSGVVRELKFKTVTFCYHPNTMTDKQFVALEEFLQNHSAEFTSLEVLTLSNRKYSCKDKLLKWIYFLRHRRKLKK